MDIPVLSSFMLLFTVQSFLTSKFIFLMWQSVMILLGNAYVDTTSPSNIPRRQREETNTYIAMQICCFFAKSVNSGSAN